MGGCKTRVLSVEPLSIFTAVTLRPGVFACTSLTMRLIA